MLVYVSGPYSAPTPEEVDANIERAAQLAVQLWAKGHAVICPHLNTAGFERRDPQIHYEAYIAVDLNMIARCDCLVLTADWQRSNGAHIERDYAKRLGIPIHVAPDLPDLHPTETRAPAQAQAFREVLGQLYRTHLSKNQDYSPANIMATGEVGLVTRLWDKIARLMNLTGFRFTIAAAGVLDPARPPAHEAVEDTYLDTAVYAIIGLLLRRGQWGR